MSSVARLRKVGGSVMVAIPTAYLDALSLGVDHQVDLSLAEGSLIMAPRHRPSYALKDLLAECNTGAERSDEDIVWASEAPVGRELI